MDLCPRCDTWRSRGSILISMADVTQILSQIEHGDSSAAEQLLPLVYQELRNLAAAKLANERPGQTLQATALVHEAYLRLVDQARPAADQPIRKRARFALLIRITAIVRGAHYRTGLSYPFGKDATQRRIERYNADVGFKAFIWGKSNGR